MNRAKLACTLTSGVVLLGLIVMPSGESLRCRCLTLSSRTDVEFALVAVLPAHRSRLKVYSLGQYSISSPVKVVVLFLKT